MGWAVVPFLDIGKGGVFCIEIFKMILKMLVMNLQGYNVVKNQMESAKIIFMDIQPGLWYNERKHSWLLHRYRKSGITRIYVEKERGYL